VFLNVDAGMRLAGDKSVPYILENAMTLTTVLVILLVLLLIGALPVYPYSRQWGYYPSGILAVVVAVVALMLLL
jgi:hypothetical protein